MAKIFLSVPILNRPELKSIYSIYKSILSSEKHQVRLYFNEGDSLISRVRNCHLTAFYDDFQECDYFMSIDSDLEVMNSFSSNNIFNKLIEHDLDFVGGLYALKQDKTDPICSSEPLDGKRQPISFDQGLIPIRWLSSGCWCIKRSVINKMIEAYPELTYEGDDTMSHRSVYGLCIPEIFEVQDSEGKSFKKYLSEDWSFCERWNKLGGKIFADTSIVLNHIGKTSYSLWNLELVQDPIVVNSPQESNDPPKAGHDLK